MTLKTVCGLTQCVLFTASFWLGLVSFTFFTLPFTIFRKLLRSIASKLYPDWGRLLSFKDAQVYEDLQADNVDTLGCVLLFGLVCEGEPSLANFQSFFQQYVLRYKTVNGEFPFEKFLYYHRPWFGYPFWRHVRNFEIKDYIRYSNEFDQCEYVTKDQLEHFLGEYQGKPFDRHSSPWELLVVKNYIEAETELQNVNQTPKFVLLFRWHHSLGDITSISKIFINIFGGEYQNGDVHDSFSPTWCFDSDEEVAAPTTWSEVRNQVRNLLKAGRSAFKFLLAPGDTNVWRVSQDMLTGTSHLVSTTKLACNVARLLSKKQQVHANSIMYAAVAGGIRQYFLDTGQGRRIPREMKMRISLPFKPYPSHLLTNFWSVGNITLPVGEPVPLKRLQIVERKRQELDKSWLTTLLYYLKMLQASLPLYFSKFDFQNKKTTLIGNNFPGPNEEILLLGEHPVAECFSYHPRLLSDAAIGVSIISYNGGIRFYLSVDKTLFPSRNSATKLAKLVEREFIAMQHNHLGVDSSDTENDFDFYKY